MAEFFNVQSKKDVKGQRKMRKGYLTEVNVKFNMVLKSSVC